MDVDIFDEKGFSIKNSKGELVCKKPFPSMPVKFWNDDGDKNINLHILKNTLMFGITEILLKLLTTEDL
jgi:acyl-coenzyme A synthetase/AMP-(fatty) acid ligase